MDNCSDEWVWIDWQKTLVSSQSRLAGDRRRHENIRRTKLNYILLFKTGYSDKTKTELYPGSVILYDIRPENSPHLQQMQLLDDTLTH